VPQLPRHRAQAAAFRARAHGRGAIHTLRVREVLRLTDDAVRVSFEVPEHLREDYRHQAGQHLVILHPHEGEEIRRSYSICLPANSTELCVAIRRVEGGAFSSFATTDLRAGARLRVMTPTGRFIPRLDARHRTHYAAVAAGSGITPIYSIVATILAAEPHSRVTLLFGNRRPSSAMLLDHLNELQRRVGDRLDLHLVYSQEEVEGAGSPGRIDWGRVAAALPDAPAGVDEWFMCGPDELMQALGRALADRHVPTNRIHTELFAASAASPLSAAELVEISSIVTLRLNDEATTFELNGRGEPILAAGLRLRSDLPYACRSGLCGTCRARLTEGEVVMERCSALDLEDRRAGYVLACVGHPVTERVTLDFDG